MVFLQHLYGTLVKTPAASAPIKRLQDAHQQNDKILELPSPTYLSRPTRAYHLLPVLPNENPSKVAEVSINDLLLGVSYDPISS